MDKGICWLEGRIQPLSEARISVMDHGLLYGDGVFEGVRFYHDTPFMLEEHLQRLLDSARAIGLDCPWPQQTLVDIVAQVVAAFSDTEGYLRILLTRGKGALGIDPRSCSRPQLIVIADRLQMIAPEVRQQGADLIIAATRRLPVDGLDPRIKSLNYLNHIMARMEANHAGAHEAILLNAQGKVTEGTADNLFLVKNGTLQTPPVTDGALAGITRQLILDLADRENLPWREHSLAPYDLYTADECFLTGTGAELIPAGSIDGRPLTQCPGPVFRKLAAGFRKHIDTVCRSRT
ncbi:branched-chain-amino-acid transaminase [Thiolapillus brandeum]|uniref:Branched-chain-amino-acid aminotransferase n=1 Tax=Thiolapillus brandeum TaxID=1076588 RepID=A0A7U6GKE5_9GAMM|nr:branched-chain-amino-acid transaminase [Thiolapillus brandeum]BAO45222.1 branched-chain amino acid aminotransferase [Thiolapillus brandeum]